MNTSEVLSNLDSKEDYLGLNLENLVPKRGTGPASGMSTSSSRVLDADWPASSMHQRWLSFMKSLEKYRMNRTRACLRQSIDFA